MAGFLPPKTGLDNVPFTLGLHNQFELLRSPPTKLNCLYVIFDLNEVLVAKWASSFCTRMWTDFTLALRPRLKDFPASCLFQFNVYIWYVP
jgi:hypothetical protein